MREVKEETGLDIVKVHAELDPMTYSTEKTVVDDSGNEVIVSKSVIQLNFIVSVSTGTVALNANEHSYSRWATREDLSELKITDAMRVVIREGLEWATSH